MKKIIPLSLVCSSVMALEFGGMGSISTSMGYAGVALKNNDFALYYNPALLPYTKTKFSFNFGATLSQKNLLELTSIDDNTATKLEQRLKGITKIFSKTNGALNIQNVVTDFVKNGMGSSNSNLQTLATNIYNALQNPQQNTDALAKSIQKVQNDAAFANLVKQEFAKSIDNKASELENSNINAGMFKNLILNVDMDKMLTLLAQSSQGTPSLEDIAREIGQVNLKALIDDKTIDDLNKLYDAIDKNDVSIATYMGAEYDMPLDENRAIGFGIHNKILANTYAGLDKEKNQIIVKINDGGDTIYVKLYKKNGSMYAEGTTKSEYEKYSAFSTNSQNHLVAKTLILTEVPVGYADTFTLPYGEISVGGSLKYINAVGYYINKKITLDLDGTNSEDLKFKDDLKNPTTTHNFGLDLGALYTLNDLSLGLVIKNINNPKIKFPQGYSIHLNPQVRIGAAYKLDFATFALDLDVLSNKTLSYHYPKSQLIGGGVKLDFTKWFDLRLGMAYDFKKDDGAILTGGFGLFDIFDMSIASGVKTAKFVDGNSSYTVPNYLDLRLNFGYRW